MHLAISWQCMSQTPSLETFSTLTLKVLSPDLDAKRDMKDFLHLILILVFARGVAKSATKMGCM